MKNIILILAIMTTFSFTGESNGFITIKTIKQQNPIDRQLDFRRTRQLKDNTLYQHKLNELLNNL